MKDRKTWNLISLILLIVGGLNWGLVGLFNWDLIASIFGEMTMVTRIVYTAIGFSALYRIGMMLNHRK